MREKLKWKQPKQLVKTTFFAAKLCSVLKLESAYPPKTEQWKVSFLSSPNLKPPEVGNISILFSQQCNLVNLDNSVSSYGYANCHIKKSPTVTLSLNYIPLEAQSASLLHFPTLCLVAFVTLC